MISRSIHRLLPLIVLILLFVGCASAKKTDSPTEKSPDGNVPHIPQVSNAQVKVLWVPDKIEENRWEAGHFLYVIEKPATWSVK